jgi:hypothetical protein
MTVRSQFATQGTRMSQVAAQIAGQSHILLDPGPSEIYYFLS